jgi:hypothetical protein
MTYDEVLAPPSYADTMGGLSGGGGSGGGAATAAGGDELHGSTSAQQQHKGTALVVQVTDPIKRDDASSSLAVVLDPLCPCLSARISLSRLPRVQCAQQSPLFHLTAAVCSTSHPVKWPSRDQASTQESARRMHLTRRLRTQHAVDPLPPLG